MSSLARHETIFKPEYLKGTPVHIIGCGATGSNIALNLVKLGVPEIHLYDMDNVEDHNLANQFFSSKDVGKNKASALAENLAQLRTNEFTEIVPHTEEVTAESAQNLIYSGIVFCVTDTMSSRSELFQNIARAQINIKQWIETRMSLDTIRVYAIDPCNCVECGKYEETLYDDDESVLSECGTTQTAFPTASALAGQAVWMMLAYLNEKEHPNEFIQFYPTFEIIQRTFVN